VNAEARWRSSSLYSASILRKLGHCRYGTLVLLRQMANDQRSAKHRKLDRHRCSDARGWL